MNRFSAASPDAACMVTGAQGRLGRLIVEDLRARGHRVIAVGRQGSSAAHPDDALVDVRDPDAVAALAEGIGARSILHLAAVLSGRDIVRTNEDIDGSIISAARAARIRHVVYASSAAVYGTDASGVVEGSALLGVGEYASSKIRGEDAFRRFASEEPGRSVQVLRIFNIAGPAFPESLVQRLLCAEPSAPVTLSEPDRFVRDYIHQSDVVAVIRAVLASRREGFEIFNVAAGAAVSSRMLISRLGVDAASILEKPGQPSTSWANISQLIRTFDIVPHSSPTAEWAFASPFS